MKAVKKRENPYEFPVIQKFYRYKSSIDKIDQISRALNLYHTKCENATMNLGNILKEIGKEPFKPLIKKPQDPFEIEVIGKFYKFQSSVDKIERMVKAFKAYHTTCGNAANTFVKTLKVSRKKPVKRLKPGVKRNQKKK